jgi:hypothetical protein
MAGEMSRADLTPEAFPLHFAVAVALSGSVEPFDVYQGPYVRLPAHKLWLVDSEADPGFVFWYDEKTDSYSDGFLPYQSDSDAFAVQAAKLLVEHGGTPKAEFDAERTTVSDIGDGPHSRLEWALQNWLNSTDPSCDCGGSDTCIDCAVRNLLGRIKPFAEREKT